MHHLILPCCSVQSLMQGRHAGVVVSLSVVVVSTVGGAISMNSGGAIGMVSTAAVVVSIDVLVVSSV